MNRRSFLAGFLACTARCSFGLTLPKVISNQIPINTWIDTSYGEVPLAWEALTKSINEMKKPNPFIIKLLNNG